MGSHAWLGSDIAQEVSTFLALRNRSVSTGGGALDGVDADGFVGDATKDGGRRCAFPPYDSVLEGDLDAE